MLLVAAIAGFVLPSEAVASSYNAVTFFQNVSPTDQTESGQVANTPTPLTPFVDLGFTDPGYTFDDWSTTATIGVGSSVYADGQLYGFGSSLSLFAQWTPDVYTLTYSAGGGSVTPDSVNYTVGESALTLAAPLWDGYTFEGWNTAPNFSGVSYAQGSVYTPTANTTLYAQWSPDVYIVTYDGEGAVVSPAFASFTVGTGALTLPGTALNDFTFDGWNSLANGTGLSYAAGASFTPASSVTLYAQWSPDIYTVTFDAEGGSVAPLSENFIVGSSASTLPTPTLTGSTFGGWNSLANGMGLSYAAGASYTPASSVTLYAQWSPDTYTVTFDPEGGSVTPPSENFTVGSSALTLPASTLIGSVFDGWNLRADGTGASYSIGALLTPTSNVTLYAQWTLDAAAVPETISFVDNGASGSIASITGTVGTSVTLPSASALTYPGFIFVGWSTGAGASGSIYEPSSSLVIKSSITLYALWAQPATVTVSFAANGGTGAVTPLGGANGSSVTLPGGTGFSEVGHTFASWNTAANGSGTVLNLGSTFLLDTSVTLYAQWDTLLAAKSPDVLIGAVGSFASNSFALTANLKTQIHRLAELTRSEHYSTETLYGYTSDTGPTRTQMVISDLRANAVATYLRQQLAGLHVSGVKVVSVGEGAVKAQTSATYRRVEVFVKA